MKMLWNLKVINLIIYNELEPKFQHINIKSSTIIFYISNISVYLQNKSNSTLHRHQISLHEGIRENNLINPVEMGKIQTAMNFHKNPNDLPCPSETTRFLNPYVKYEK